MSKILAFAERFAFLLSTARVQECILSLQNGDIWQRLEDEGIHRHKPYPMGFYPDNPNLYYALGWGTHEHLFSYEQWLIRRVAKRCVP